MVKSLKSALIWRGVLALIVGVVAIAWPGITVGAFVILFAVYAFLSAISDLEMAFRSDRAGPVVGHILLALLDAAAGVIALVWPGATAFLLTIFVGAWALAGGVIEIVMAFRRGETVGERAMWALGGVVAIVLGVALFLHPDIGALSLATVFGLFSLIYGFAMLTTAAQARSVEKAATRLTASV